MKKLLLFIFLIIQLSAYAQWATYSLPKDFPVYYSFTDLIYSSKQIVWARYRTSASPTYKSIDGGANFSIVNNLAFSLFRPLNDSLIFALDWYGKFVKSTDGGHSFSYFPIVNVLGDSGFKTTSILDFHFYNDSVGWVLGDDTTSGCKEIWRTENGGALWERVPCEQIYIPNTPLGFNNYFKKSFAQNKLFLFNTKLRFNKTRLVVVEDMGKKWIQRDIIPNVYSLFSSFVFLDSLHGIVGLSIKDTTFAITNDGGLSWSYTNVPSYVGGKIVFAKSTDKKRSFLISGGTNGASISYDTAKTWIFIDDYVHSNISFFDAETGISMTQPTPQRNGAIRVFNGYLPDPVGVYEKGKVDNNVTVFPNPSNSGIRILLNNTLKVQKVEITNMEGKLVLKNLFDHYGQDVISVSSLNNGLYFIAVTDNNGFVHYAKLAVKH